MKYSSLLILSVLLTCNAIFAQDDLLNELEEETKDQVFEQPAFKAMKIGNLQSTKLAGKGDVYMYVSHRFGDLKKWKRTFFGFDSANTKLQMFYGVTNFLQLGIGRESYLKAYTGHAKISLFKQGEKSPVNLVCYTLGSLRTDLLKENYPRIKLSDRMSYATQLLVSRRISNNLSFEIAPTYLRYNLIKNGEDFIPPSTFKHNYFALAAGGRIKLSKRISFNAEYSYNFNRDKEQPILVDPFTFGLDIETGGHVFQLLFTNSQSTNETGFMNFANKTMYFGFNIVRVF